ncbi:MAG: hypothetical protein JST75_05310 [Bacteroidetes bacterium]|nr:hypothetical protein [Bacteroidota bacterium]
MSANIQLVSNNNNYELVLPDSIRDAFGLKDQNGNQLSIKSENKMQLEWLAQSIVSSFTKLNEYRTISNKKLNRKKTMCVALLAICGIVALAKTNIANLFHTTPLYINLIVFGVAIISCLQLLKYFALGISAINQGDFSSDPEIEQIKEMILKDYSVRNF